MDKIKEHINNLLEIDPDDTFCSYVNIPALEIDMKYLVKHVEELKKDISNYKKACSAWEALESYGRKENQRYKQALEEIQFQTSISETSGGIFDIAMEALKEAESND